MTSGNVPLCFTTPPGFSSVRGGHASCFGFGPMASLIDVLLSAGHPAMSSEEAACDLVVAARWGSGDIPCPKCGRTCIRSLARITCPNEHVFTIFVGTPLGSLRRPRAHAILRAASAMTKAHRSASARELARDLGVPHVTLWRHMMRLRKMMPRAPSRVTPRAAVVAICGRRSRAAPASAVVGARHTMRVARGSASAAAWPRLLGESVRTWLNGTFHGVTAQWLHRYLQEVTARWAYDALHLAERVARWLTRGGAPLFFERHVRPLDREPA